MNNKSLLSIFMGLSFLHQLTGMEDAPYKQWDGEYYHNYATPDFDLPIKLLTELPLPTFVKILDIGCGPGNITAWIAKHAPESIVQGIDPSDSMIQHAKKEYSDITNLTFDIADAQSVNAENAYDLIFSCNALHWIKTENQTKIVCACSRALKKNGLLFIIMEGKNNNPSALERAFFKTAFMPAWTFLQKVNINLYHHPHNAESFRPLLEHAELAPLEMRIIDEPRTFENLQQLKYFMPCCLGEFAPVTSLPKQEQTQLISDVIDNYAKEIKPDDHGLIAWTSPRFFACAQKK